MFLSPSFLRKATKVHKQKAFTSKARYFLGTVFFRDRLLLVFIGTGNFSEWAISVRQRSPTNVRQHNVQAGHGSKAALRPISTIGFPFLFS